VSSSHPAWTERLEQRHPPRRHEGLLEMIGGTPLIRLREVTRTLAEGVEVWVKMECMNPGGSVKDRPARQIILDAIDRGELGSGQILLDATSGNTGIAYSMIGAALGIEVHLVMPENVSPQRKEIVEAYGARIIYSDPMDGSDGAIRMARELVEQDAGERYYYADQYRNPSNPRAHQQTTAPEIWAQTVGQVTHFVAATGTSGTVMGTGRGLKEKNPAIQVIGAQPSDSFHGLEGLKHMPSSLKPGIYVEEELDEIRWVDTDAGWDMAEEMAVREGIACGNSAGANVVAALDVARDLTRGVVVTVICDHADRYFGE
jgi:S-sulfo-L-cysteine synthase (O-acetyl-L-serine-dependent)